MFQPSLRAFDGAGAVAAPVPSSSRPAAKLRLTTAALAELELVVDLGEQVGSRTWWRGLATLGVLGWTSIAIGTQPVRLPEPVPLPLLPAQVQLAQSAAIAPLALGGGTGAVAQPTARVVPLAEPPERPRIEVTARLGAVDSSDGALRRAGVSRADIATIAELIAGAVDPRSVKPGTSFDLVLGRRETKSMPRPLEQLAFRAALDLKLLITRAADGTLLLTRIPVRIDNTPLRVSGTVGTSLYKAARAAGLPSSVVADAIKALSYSIDIQRDVRSKDSFDLVVAHRRAETGETEVGQLLYAAIDGKKDAAVMRWSAGGKSQFFLPDGSSAKKGLMRTPVDGARITSGFGFRMHPVLGYSRLHKGIDFGVGHGTPVMAAASGVIDYAGYSGGHGNYVRIKHSGGYRTSYSHLSRFAVRSGARVEQGQVIGYVGSTGLSTGPHLHYEVYVNGTAVDPRQAKFRGGTQLSGSELARFKSELARLRSLRPAGNAAEQETTSIAQADKADRKG